MHANTPSMTSTSDRVRHFFNDRFPWPFWLILLGAAALRFSLSLWNRDFWYDEAFTGILLGSPWDEMNRMIVADVHPPLYYWLAKPLSSAFGYSPAGIRLFSVVMSIASLFPLYRIGVRLFSRRVATAAVFLFAFSPFAVEYAQEARMYSLFGFLMLLSVSHFHLALKEGRDRDWIMWGVFGGLSFLTHYLSLFFFPLFFIVFVVWRISIDKKTWWKAVFGDRGFWIGVASILPFFLSWSTIFLTHVSKGNLGWIDVTFFSALPSTVQIFLFGHPPGTGGVPSANPFRGIFDGSSVGLIVLIASAALFALAWHGKRKRGEILILSGLSVGVLLLLIVLSHLDIKLYVSRYFMPAALFTYLLIPGLVFTRFRGRFALPIFLLAYSLLLVFLKPIPYDSDWSRIAGMRTSGMLPERTIITTDPFAYTSARYYFGTDNVRYHNRNNPAEDFSGWVVVGNENRLLTAEAVREFPDAVIVTGSCDWAGLRLEEVFRLEKHSVCRLVRP